MKNIHKIALLAVVLFTMLTIVNKPVFAESSSDTISGSSAIPENRTDADSDIRVEKLKVFLDSHKSPMADYADEFVRYADQNGMSDKWSMVAAVAGVESTFGKHTPKNSYNAWGWGIPTGKQSGIAFSDWEEGIAVVSKSLKEKYIDKGADTLPEIQRRYAPVSTTWAGKVAFFMKKIESTEVTKNLSI